VIQIVEQELAAGDTEVDISEALPIDRVKSVMVFWEEDGIARDRHIRPVGSPPELEDDPNYSYDAETAKVVLTHALPETLTIKVYVVKT
jgi:hypothetical protein